MQAVQVSDAEVKVCKYVDDMKLWTIGGSQEVAAAIFHAYKEVKAKLEDRKAVVNIQKTGFVASTPETKDALSRLKEEGKFGLGLRT